MTKFTLPEAGAPIIRAWPCTISEPADSPDGVARATARTMTVRFELLDADEVGALLKDGEQAVLKRVTKGWDTAYESGAPVPFDEFERYLRVPYIRAGLWRGYMQFIQGIAEKN